MLPSRASSTEVGLSIAQALLGLATVYLVLTDVLYEKTKGQDAKRQGMSGDGRTELPCDMRRLRGLRRRPRRLTPLICRWQVWLAYGAGIVLLGLEMIAIGVVWTSERIAKTALGRFVHASFVAAIARDTGPVPFNVDERGNVMVVAAVVGTARYTSSNFVIAFLVFLVCLLFGCAAIVLAVYPVLLWHRFSNPKIAKRYKGFRTKAAVSSNGADTVQPVTPELLLHDGKLAHTTHISAVSTASSRPDVSFATC